MDDEIEEHTASKATSLNISMEVDGGVIWEMGCAEVEEPGHFLFVLSFYIIILKIAISHYK